MLHLKYNHSGNQPHMHAIYVLVLFSVHATVHAIKQEHAIGASCALVILQ